MGNDDGEASTPGFFHCVLLEIIALCSIVTNRTLRLLIDLPARGDSGVGLSPQGLCTMNSWLVPGSAASGLVVVVVCVCVCVCVSVFVHARVFVCACVCLCRSTHVFVCLAVSAMIPGLARPFRVPT